MHKYFAPNNRHWQMISLMTLESQDSTGIYSVQMVKNIADKLGEQSIKFCGHCTALPLSRSGHALKCKTIF